MNRCLCAAGAAAALLAGCASDEVIFLSKTSMAIDVAAQPGGASIGYDRVEGYFGPRFDDSRVPSVAASFVTNGELFGRHIRQVYATGKAAEIVTAESRSSDPPRAPENKSDAHKAMFFSTGTTVGLKVGFGTAAATEMTLGYKRRELSVIPITKGEFPSVLATIETDQDAQAAQQTRFGAGQYFATGIAAQVVANDPEVRNLFRRRMRSALGAVELEEKSQAEKALSTLQCLSMLRDDQLPRVFASAQAHQLFEKDVPGLPARLAALPPGEARTVYTRYLSAVDGADTARGQAMALHREAVCTLAGR